jgi:hypothetical protein
VSERARDTAHAVPQANIETLDALYASFNAREFEAGARYLDPELELYPGVLAPDHDAKFHGRQGWLEFVRVALEIWEQVTIEPQERITTEDGRILSIDLWHFHGSQGIEVLRELPNLFSFRDGLVVRIDGFTDKAEALKALE